MENDITPTKRLFGLQISPNIDSGHLLQALLLFAQFIGGVVFVTVMWATYTQDSRRHGETLLRHEQLIEQNAKAINNLLLTDAESQQQRKHLREMIDEIKRGQEKILDYINSRSQ